MTNNYEHQICQKDKENLLHPFTEFAEFNKTGSRLFTKSEGAYVYGPGGKKYLDGIGGLWCVNIGYGRAEMVEAIANQAAELPYYNTFTDMTSAPAAELAHKLAELAPGDLNHVFFTSGGSVSNDTAVRLAHYYFQVQGRSSKKKIISRMEAYHGSTYLAASLTGITHNHAGFHLIDEGGDALVHYVSSPNVYRKPDGVDDAAFCDKLVAEFEDKIAELGADNIACFFAEPIMGAGGVLMAPDGYHKRMLEVCRRNDILYVSDEVVTAFGRLGHWFASKDVFDIEPDIICVAKGISSGYIPLGAAIYSDRIHDVISGPNDGPGCFSHGFTYSGHPVACAAGLKNIQLMEQDDICGHIKSVGPYFEERLRALASLPIVGDVRGSHFMMSLEFVSDKAAKTSFGSDIAIGKRIAHHCYVDGLIARNVGDYIILSPPLILDMGQIDWLVDTLETAIRRTVDDLAREQLWQAA